MYKITKSIEISANKDKMWIKDYKLANKINRELNHYKEYRFKCGEEAYFKVSQMEYKRLEGLFLLLF